MPWQPRKKARLWKRAARDFYLEPADCTAALLRVEALDGEIWDPACGVGHVVATLRAAGRNAYGTDCMRRVPEATPWFLAEHDFLGEAVWPSRPDHIVCNPPFGRGLTAEAFIRQALGLARRSVAVFVDYRFLASARRWTGLFREHPPARAWLLYPRPSCPPGDYLLGGGRAEGGTADFVWLVWECGRAGPLQFAGLDRRPPPEPATPALSEAA